MEGFFRAHEGWLNEDKDTQIDLVLAQKISSRSELLQSHALVEVLQNIGMRCLQAHRHFQSPIEHATEGAASLPYERGMAFHDDAIEVSHPLRDRCVIFNGDGARIEEASAVVQLDCARRR